MRSSLAWRHRCGIVLVGWLAALGCTPGGTGPPPTPSPVLPPGGILERYVLPIDGTSFSLEFLRDENIHTSGQLPGNHSLYPHGVLLYLYPDDVPRLRSMGLRPVKVDTLPPGIVPTHMHLHDCDHPVPPERYCAYADRDIHDRCDNETILSRLGEYAARPPVAGTDYATLVTYELQTPERSLPLYGLRIGARATEGGAPQVLVVATQHAREWVTTEAAMSLIDHYVEQSAVVGTPEHTALQNVVLTVVPVSNPDGYEHTQTSYSDPQPLDWRTRRNWRPSREACSTDINRNFPFSREQPGAGTTCLGLSAGSNSTFHGDSTLPETAAAIVALQDPDFPTVLALNVHSYGQLVLYTDGVSPGFSPCTTNSNCSHPDVPVQMLLGGNHRRALFKDVETGAPYRPGQIYRNIYAASGDLGSHAHMVEGAMSLSLEIGRGTCGFGAETRHDDLNQEPAKQLREMIASWLPLAQGFADQTVYDTHPDLGTYVLPHLHRRRATGGVLGEHPTLRVSGRTHIASITVLPNNGAASAFMDANDDVSPGIGYKSFRWRPAGDPFVFPTLLQLCGDEEANCMPIGLVGDGDEIDVCGTDGWTADGWDHEGRGTDPSTVQDQCYWYLTGSGSGMVGGHPNIWTLNRAADLTDIVKSNLSFSYDRSTPTGIDLQIKASRSGTFDPCDTGTACRTVYASRLPNGFNVNQSGMRTEIVDISDFDRGVVHLRWELRDSSPTDREVKIYDPVIVGFRR